MVIQIWVTTWSKGACGVSRACAEDTQALVLGGVADENLGSLLGRAGYRAGQRDGWSCHIRKPKESV